MSRANHVPKLFVLLLVVLGCGGSLTLPRLDIVGAAGTTLHVYDHGKILREEPFSATSPVADAIDVLLSENREGWQRDYATYAPTVYVQSAKWTVTLLSGNNRVVVNFAQDDGTWEQVSRDIEGAQGIVTSALGQR